MSKLQKSIAVILGVFILFELSLYFATNDLTIWLTYGNLDSQTGIFMEVIGKIIAPLLFGVCGIVLAVYFFKEIGKFNIKSAIGGLFTVGGLAYSIYVFQELNSVWLTIILSLVVCGLLFWLFSVLNKLDEGRLFQIYCIALTAIVYCLALLVVISLMKVFWGRIRPRDLQTLEQFTAWYLPQGYTGNFSFPSGHTGNASAVLIMTMFVPLVKNIWGKISLYVLPIIWVILMATSRVIVGAHYGSDTLFAIAVSVVLLILSKKYVIKYISTHL